MLSNGSFANPKWTELSLGDLMFFLRLVEEKSLTEAAKAFLELIDNIEEDKD